MIDDEIRAMLLAGADCVQYPITMEERAKLHILPADLNYQFLKALDRYMEGRMWEAMWTEPYERKYKDWQRVHKQIEQAEGK